MLKGISGMVSVAVLLLLSNTTALAGGPIQSSTGKCLDSPCPEKNGCNVQVWDCNGRPNQEWTFQDGMFKSWKGKCLDIQDFCAGNNGCNVQVLDCNGSPNQKWTFQDGMFKSGTGKCLDIHGPCAGNNGCNVQVWDCNGSSPNQKWNTFNEDSGKCITDINVYPTSNDLPTWGYDGENAIKVGCWDVANPGATAVKRDDSTKYVTGNHTTSLSAKRGPISGSICIEDIKLYASRGNEAHPAPDGGYEYIAHWGIGDGAGYGKGNKHLSEETMTLFVKRATTKSEQVVTNLWLHQADTEHGDIKPPTFESLGWWDVDQGGGSGTVDVGGLGGSTGDYMMTLSYKKKDYKYTSPRPVGRWEIACSGGQSCTSQIKQSLTWSEGQSDTTEKTVNQTISWGFSVTHTTGLTVPLKGGAEGSAENSITFDYSKENSESFSQAKTIATERALGYEETCSSTTDMLNYDIHTVWQWVVDAYAFGGKKAAIKTCQLACTSDGKRPDYLPTDPKAASSCRKKIGGSNPDTGKTAPKGPAGSFQKDGNNGTVSCNTFCGKVKADGTPEWGTKIGTCVEAKNESTGKTVSCDTVPGLIPDGKQLTCTCR
ncbi:MAG: hypothetical protein D3917_10800 [Candidatus Electrothrix sp. AX5]|nr:hypothetical protein [Candidatus Electrothrix sp. AX5]